MNSEKTLHNYWWIFNYLLAGTKYINFKYKNNSYPLDIINNTSGNINAVEFSSTLLNDKNFILKLNKFLLKNNIDKISFNIFKDDFIKNKNDQEILLLKNNVFNIERVEKIILFLGSDINLLFSKIRKSYKSIINYNKKICEIKNYYLENKSISNNMIDEWIDLYSEKINKNINNETKNYFKKSIDCKEAILISCYFENQFTGGVVFNINQVKATYSLSANIINNNLKSSTAGHLLIWEAINFLLSKKIKYIDFGSILNLSGNKININQFKKIKNIEKFKFGFGGEPCFFNRASKSI